MTSLDQAEGADIVSAMSKVSNRPVAGIQMYDEHRAAHASRSRRTMRAAIY
jgi:hypothetical protein